MAFFAPKTEQKEFQSVASGTYVGRCYSFIDLGTQTIQSQYGEQQKHQIRLSFELPEELIEIKGEQKPYSVHSTFTLSTHEKSQLMGLLKARQNVTDGSTFDLTSLVGKEGLLNVVNDGKFANVKTISPLVKGMTCKPQINKSVIITLDENFDEKAFDALSGKTKEKIHGSPERESVVALLEKKREQEENGQF